MTRPSWQIGTMKHYEFPMVFRSIYDKAVDLYAQGKRGAGGYFNATETAFLAANGITPQHIYDYAEDQNNYGEPGYDLALSIELIRRDYFLNLQHGQASAKVLDPESLPAKAATARGIAWLPRIMPKARAKLYGELPASIMYCCAGDRGFFKANDILPGEFLLLLWRHPHDDQAVVDWVAARAKAPAAV